MNGKPETSDTGNETVNIIDGDIMPVEGADIDVNAFFGTDQEDAEDGTMEDVFKDLTEANEEKPSKDTGEEPETEEDKEEDNGEKGNTEAKKWGGIFQTPEEMEKDWHSRNYHLNRLKAENEALLAMMQNPQAQQVQQQAKEEDSPQVQQVFKVLSKIAGDYEDEGSLKEAAKELVNVLSPQQVVDQRLQEMEDQQFWTSPETQEIVPFMDALVERNPLGRKVLTAKGMVPVRDVQKFVAQMLMSGRQAVSQRQNTNTEKVERVETMEKRQPEKTVTKVKPDKKEAARGGGRSSAGAGKNYGLTDAQVLKLKSTGITSERALKVFAETGLPQ